MTPFAARHLNSALLAVLVTLSVSATIYVLRINNQFEKDRQEYSLTKSHEIARLAETLRSLEDSLRSLTFGKKTVTREHVETSIAKTKSHLSELSRQHTFETYDHQTQALQVAIPLMNDLSIWFEKGIDGVPANTRQIYRIASQRVYLGRIQLETIYSAARSKTAGLLKKQSDQLRSFGGTVIVLLGGFLSVLTLATLLYNRNRQHEKDLWRQQTLISNSLNSINEGFVLTGSEGQARLVNESLNNMCRHLAFNLENGKTYQEALSLVLQAGDLREVRTVNAPPNPKVEDQVDDRVDDQVDSKANSRIDNRQITSGRRANTAQTEYLTSGGAYLRVNERNTEDGGQVITFTDITDLKLTEDKLQRQANYDYLTTIANRSYYVERLGESLSRAKRHGHKVALMQFDLDKFKQVNDTLGHAVGDELLIETANRIKRNLRDIDLAARIGGDEFAAIIDQINDQDEAVRSAERIMQELYQELEIEGVHIDFSASIGIAVYPDHAHDIESLMQHADIACYRAKASGRNNCQLYGSDMKVQAMELMTLENRLRKAIEKDQLSVHYQPIMALDANKITCVEAFSRWHDEKLGDVSPAQFIPVADKNGLITVLGDQILRKVFAQLSEWSQQGVDNVKVAINISQRQLFQPNLTNTIDELSDEFGVNTNKLLFEITEAAITSDVDAATERLTQLARRNIEIVLDDYGKGNSSLQRIMNLSIKCLKIDGSFIREIGYKRETRDIVRAMISSSLTLNISTIAEAVETTEQLDFLKDVGCTMVQGYLIGDAQPGNEVFESYLESKDGLNEIIRRSA